MKAASELRNDLMHSQWSHLQQGNDYIPVKANFKKQNDAYAVELTTELEPLIRKVLVAVKEVERNFLLLPESLREHKIERDSEGFLVPHERNLD